MIWMNRLLLAIYRDISDNQSTCSPTMDESKDEQQPSSKIRLDHIKALRDLNYSATWI